MNSNTTDFQAKKELLDKIEKITGENMDFQRGYYAACYGITTYLDGASPAFLAGLKFRNEEFEKALHEAVNDSLKPNCDGLKRF